MEKEYILKALFLLSLAMICMDTALSYAYVGYGFYELNNFTNRCGLFTHTFILLMFNTIIMMYSRYEDKFTPGIAYFAVFDIIWILNNIYSLYLVI